MFETLNTVTEDVLLRLGWNGRKPYTLPGNLHSRVLIAGLPAAGQRALLNSLWGWEVLAEGNRRPGVQEYGIFALAELPDAEDDAETILMQMVEAQVIVYVLDERKGLRPVDFLWTARLRASDAAFVVVLNTGRTVPDAARLDDIKRRLGSSVIPLNVADQTAVRSLLLPAMLDASPSVGVPLCSEIVDLRRQVASRLILKNAIASALTNVQANPRQEAVPASDLRSNLVLQLAEIYGRKPQHGDEANVLVTTLAELAHNYVDTTLRTVVPQAAGPLGACLLAAALTWVMGTAAQAYFGEELPPVESWLEAGWERLQHVLPRG